MHNTLFLVAHFHNMLIPGLLFGMLAGYHYWFPKAFGFRLDETWGRIAFACWVVGFLLAFMPLYALGHPGHAAAHGRIFRSRLSALHDRRGDRCRCSSCAASASLVVQLWVSVRRRERASSPAIHGTGARSNGPVSAPPPEYNFAILPTVHGRDPFTP